MGLVSCDGGRYNLRTDGVGTWGVGLSREAVSRGSHVWVLWPNIRKASWGQARKKSSPAALVREPLLISGALEVGRLGARELSVLMGEESPDGRTDGRTEPHRDLRPESGSRITRRGRLRHSVL